MLAEIKLTGFGQRIFFKVGLDTLPVQLEALENVSSLIRAILFNAALDLDFEEEEKASFFKGLQEQKSHINKLKKLALESHQKKEKKGAQRAMRLPPMEASEVHSNSQDAQQQDVAALDTRIAGPIAPELDDPVQAPGHSHSHVSKYEACNQSHNQVHAPNEGLLPSTSRDGMRVLGKSHAPQKQFRVTGFNMWSYLFQKSRVRPYKDDPQENLVNAKSPILPALDAQNNK